MDSPSKAPIRSKSFPCHNVIMASDKASTIHPTRPIALNNKNKVFSHRLLEMQLEYFQIYFYFHLPFDVCLLFRVGKHVFNRQVTSGTTRIILVLLSSDYKICALLRRTLFYCPYTISPKKFHVTYLNIFPRFALLSLGNHMITTLTMESLPVGHW